MSKNNDKKLMDKKSPKKFSTMFARWVGLGVSGKIKCAVLGRLVEGKTALLILPKRWHFVFHFIVRLLSVVSFFRVTHNGYVYETFGISKRFPVKLQLLLIRAKTLDKPLTAKCFIYDVCALHEQRTPTPKL